jgi:2-oxoglutarate dehydrogenase E1 component
MQACAQYNIQVANFTAPAQLFHALRRQVKRDFRKPLIVMSPKSLLRHTKVVSTLEDLSRGSFQEILLDPKIKDYKNVENFVFCSGKVYFDADDARDKNNLVSEKTALIRVEQLYPFPEKKIAELLKSAKKIKRVIWMQEEPKNMGAYTTISPWFQDVLDQLGYESLRVGYIGREMRASPATGSPYKHQKEQAAIVEDFLSIYR